MCTKELEEWSVEGEEKVQLLVRIFKTWSYGNCTNLMHTFDSGPVVDLVHGRRPDGPARLFIFFQARGRGQAQVQEEAQPRDSGAWTPPRRLERLMVERPCSEHVGGACGQEVGEQKWP